MGLTLRLLVKQDFNHKTVIRWAWESIQSAVQDQDSAISHLAHPASQPSGASLETSRPVPSNAPPATGTHESLCTFNAHSTEEQRTESQRQSDYLCRFCQSHMICSMSSLTPSIKPSSSPNIRIGPKCISPAVVALQCSGVQYSMSCCMTIGTLIQMVHEPTCLLSRITSLLASFLLTSFLMVRTRVAYWRELELSSMLLSLGETFTNMRVLALPPRESLISMVSL